MRYVISNTTDKVNCGVIVEGDTLLDIIFKVEQLFSMSFTISLVKKEKVHIRNSHICVVLKKLN